MRDSILYITESMLIMLVIGLLATIAFKEIPSIEANVFICSLVILNRITKYWDKLP